MIVLSGKDDVVVELPAPASGSPHLEPTTRAGLPEAPATAIDGISSTRKSPLSEAMRCACALAIHDGSIGELHRAPRRAVALIERNLGCYTDAQLASWQMWIPPALWSIKWTGACMKTRQLFPALDGVDELPDFYEADFPALHRDCHACVDGPGATCRCVR